MPCMRTLQSEFPKRAEQFRQGSQVSGDVLNVFAFKSRIHNMVSVLSMAFYSPHNRFEGRPSCRGNVSIFWAQRFERKSRTKIAAPQN